MLKYSSKNKKNIKESYVMLNLLGDKVEVQSMR